MIATLRLELARIFPASCLALVALASPLRAQNLTLNGPWTFTGGRGTQLGDVDICRTNAPAGGFWGGQPVLAAHADVDEALINTSTCFAGVRARVSFQLGPAPTWVIFECTLNGIYDVRVPGGSASTSAIGDIDGTRMLSCAGRPINQLGRGTRPIAAYGRIRLCFDPGNHIAGGTFKVAATAPPDPIRNRHAVANFDQPPVANPGLPFGFMLILMPDGPCGDLGRLPGDVDGDGRFGAADVALVAGLLRAPEEEEDAPLYARWALADIVAPCTGRPDRADLVRLAAALRRPPADRPARLETACPAPGAPLSPSAVSSRSSSRR